MSIMTQQRSTNMNQQRDPLIGQFFIVRNVEGQASKAGRIRSRTPDGLYNVTVYTSKDGARGELANVARMESEGWELFINETHWRHAYDASLR
jgi:hypothetical protein